MSILSTSLFEGKIFPEKTRKLTTTLVFLFVWMLMPSLMQAQNRYVSVTGADAGDCSLPGSPCLTIQYAVNQAVAGDNINVSAGTYNENVAINKSLQMLGTNASVTGTPPALGTFVVTPGVNDVTIDGFTLIGYDSPFPGIEYAALYLQGNHNNITITNNTITADGEAALLDEFGGICTNLIIDNNLFNGQTFVGVNPGDCGFANQFTAMNVPRQLIVIGNSDSNIQFTNNTIDGIAGGPGLVPPCDVTGQGNTMVTIDATNVTITGNYFGGLTTRFASLLRTRGTQNNISGNTFDGSDLEGSAFFHFLGPNALVGGMPSTPEDLVDANTYIPGAIAVTSGGNTSIIACTGPILSASINGVATTHTENDGVSDTLSFDVCNVTDNITINGLSDLFTPPLANVKAFQIFETDNVSVPYCDNCVAPLAAFTNITNTISLVDNTISGTLTLKFVAFTDTNDDNVMDPTECFSDTVIYIISLYPPVTSADIAADPTGDLCIGTTGVQYSVNLTGGSASTTYLWCAYNTIDGTGTCFDAFQPDNTSPNPTRSWTSSTGPKSVGVTISQPGCPTITDLYAFNVVADPIGPMLDVADPAGANICAGDTVSVTFIPGSGGTGNCADEFQYSTDNGVNYFPYSPGGSIYAGTETVIVQGRRLCDGPGCDGAGENFVTLKTWGINSNPTVAILPNPAEVCAGADLTLNGNPSGGSGVYVSHLWSGLHVDSLDNPSIQMPTFTSDNAGSFALNYMVADDNGCVGSGSIVITVNDNPIATVLPDPANVCPGGDLVLDGNPSGGSETYTTHAWTGAGATSLDNVAIQMPTFSNGTSGAYDLTYTVTDDNGCVGSDNITVNVLETPEIETTVLGVTITNPGPVLLTRQLCNVNNNVTAGPIAQTNASPDAFLYIEIINSQNINLAGGGPGGDTDRLDDLPLDGPLATVGSNWMDFIDDIRLQAGAQWGFVEIRIRPYTDIDGSDDLTPEDCLGTQVDLRFEIQPIPQTSATFINPDAQDGSICSGETIDIDLGTNNFEMIGGGTPALSDYEFEVVQIRYSTDNGATYPAGNAGYPAGLTGGTYTVGDIIASSVAEISETLNNNTSAPIYLRYQVMAQLTNDPFCADGPINIRVVINPNPIPNASPQDGEVCAGLNLDLFGNPSGIPPFVTHAWTGPGAAYVSPTDTENTVFNHDVEGVYEIYYTVTDGNGCSGSDTITVTVNANPTANITPEPAEACILTDIQLNGNPSGGSEPYSHSWTGMGAPYLSSTTIVNPIFNHNELGPYEVTYTVTDNNGCIGSDVLTILLTDNEEPVINCPAGPVIMNTDTDRCDAVVCFPISATDDCPFYTPETLADHVFIGTFGGSTYFRSVNAMSWEDANAQAASLGGHLVNITSVAEQNYLASNIPNLPTSTFWIGLRYSRSLGAYKWTSGAPLTYTNWAFGEPALFGSHDYVFYWDAISPLARGWHDTPAEVLNIPVNQRYIIEFSGLPEILTAGLPSGSIFPLGTTMVTYETTDSAGNQDDCTFAVQVVDNQDPVVTCPQDITVYLEPLECETVVDYEATATDNCSVSSIDYSITPGSIFPIGITPVDVTATDGSGNTSMCSFNVIVYDYINENLACKPVNLSLDELCSTSLDPTIFLTGWQTPDPNEILLGCLDNFIITFLGKNNEVIPVDQLRYHIGKTLRFRVSHTLQSFTCWNDVLIEDKFPPTIDCRDITVNCLASTDNLEVAFASDNCGATPLLINETHQVIQCDDNFIGSITRRYVAVDKYGNQSVDSCTAVIYLERSNFGGIVPPVNDTLQCSDNFKKDTKGFNNPDPSVTGVPTFNGVPVYPTSALNMLFCNASIDYEDVILIDTPCKKKIRRTWKIYEWHCSNLETFFIGLPQMIDIIDNTPPVIPPVSDMLLTTKTKSCSASATLPALNITDNCNTVKSVNINVTNGGLAVGHLPTNGGVLELPVGTNEVVYQAIDFCGNTSERRFIVTVRDNTNPIALCDQYTTVSIKTNGYTEVTAVAVDDGSFDECGEVSLLLQRMEDPCGTDYNIGWHERVGFCCEDANTSRMVTLLVTDEGGNTNMCMVTVNVQEKVNPTIACPPHVTISDCTYTFDPNNLDFYFGAATITDNCPANNDLIQDFEDGRNQCGTGELVRFFEVRSNGVSYGSCTQTITFENNDAFDGYDPADLQWPADYTAVNECDVLNLEPEMLPPGFDMPVIIQDACDRVGFTKNDLVFPFTTNGSCFKIIRTWTVLDWCQTDIEGNYLTWTHEQEIKVMDNEAPVITSPDTTRVTYSFDANCAGGQIELTASAEDCTPEDELAWEYIIYDAEGDVYETGSSNDASGFFPLGDYLIEFTVEDRCGNLATTSYTFEIISVKSATPICFQGLSTDLVAMDIDSNGTADTAMVTIHIEMFNNHSYHDCYPDEPLLFSFSTDVNDTVRVFGCADLGLQPITMYVTDINGNQAFCATDILITNNDTNYVCPGQLIEGFISGKIVNEHDVAIAGVTVELGGTEIDDQMTGDNGEFAFGSLPFGGNYNVQPIKDGDDLNGVSTLDLVLIQRHILGMEKLPTMYKYIAGDVNKDNKINTIDLVELRKLILGTLMELPNNTSWRFLEQNYQFIDPNNPLALIIPGNCAIQNLQQEMKANFIGVKVGDVNESAKLNGFGSDELENRHYFAFRAESKLVKAGEMVRVAVRANSNTTLLGWQSQIAVQGGELISVESDVIAGIQEHYVMRDNQVLFSTALGMGQVVRTDDVLFTITFRAGRDGHIQEFISIENTGLRPEVYTDNTQSAKSLKWSWTEVTDDVFAITKHQPNPWKESTLVGFSIPKSDMVSVKVKDQTGRTVYSATDFYQAGEQQIILTRDAIQNSGMYFVEIKYNREVQTIKTIMID